MSIRKCTLILMALFLSSCNGMTNQEVVKEIKYCEENGMKAKVYVRHMNVVYKVVCLPEEGAA